MIPRIVIAVLLAASLAVTYMELNRWRDSAYISTLTSPQRGRRIAGSVILLTVLGMAYCGTYFPAKAANALNFSLQMLYWLTCLFLAGVLILIAGLEARASLHRLIDERRQVRSHALGGMEDLIQQALKETDPNTDPGDRPEAG